MNAIAGVVKSIDQLVQEDLKRGGLKENSLIMLDSDLEVDVSANQRKLELYSQLLDQLMSIGERSH